MTNPRPRPPLHASAEYLTLPAPAISEWLTGPFDFVPLASIGPIGRAVPVFGHFGRTTPFGKSRMTATASTLPLQQCLEPLRRDRERGDGARNPDGVIDRGGERCAGRIGAALARPLEAERIERARRVLGDQHVDRRRLAR